DAGPTRRIRASRCSTSAATRSCAATISTHSISRNAARRCRSPPARSSTGSSAAASRSRISRCASRCSAPATSASSTCPQHRRSSRSSSMRARPGARASPSTGGSAATAKSVCRSGAPVSQRVRYCSERCRSSSSMRIRSNDRTRTRFSAYASAAAGRALLFHAWLVAAALAVAPLDTAAQDGSARIHVRRIELRGIERTADAALRRELVQLEGAVLNTAALDESLRRIRSLRFIESVDATLRPVPGSPDVVDIVLTVAEAPARRYGGGGGWSESLRASARAYYTNENLFGTGQRLSFAADASELRSAFELSHTTPHVRDSEIGRTIEATSRRVDRLTKDTAVVDARLTSLSLEYGYPLAGRGRRASAPLALAPALAAAEARLPTPELRDRLAAVGAVLDALRPTACCSTLRVGVALRRSELIPALDVGTQLVDWVAETGDGLVGDGLRPSADLREVDL